MLGAYFENEIKKSKGVESKMKKRTREITIKMTESEYEKLISLISEDDTIDETEQSFIVNKIFDRPIVTVECKQLLSDISEILRNVAFNVNKFYKMMDTTGMEFFEKGKIITSANIAIIRGELGDLYLEQYKAFLWIKELECRLKAEDMCE